MKTKIFLSLFCLMFIFSGAQAQKDPVNDIIKSVGSQASMGSLMGTMVNGIKPSAFMDGKTGKNDIIKQLSGIDATDYLKYASVAGELAGVLKSTAFLPDWANKKDGILDQITNASSIANVAGGLVGMTSLLNPSSLTKGFKKNQNSWKSAMDVLSLIK